MEGHSVLGGDNDDEGGTKMTPGGVMKAGASPRNEKVEFNQLPTGTSEDDLDSQDWEEAPTDVDGVRGRAGSLSTSPPVDIYSWAQCGYLAQYFSVGLIYGGLPATVYGFFLGYLHTPSYVYSTALTLCVFPWSFKFLFGLINDTRPIGGYHRKPYMVGGWGMCAVMLVCLSMYTIPPPYWCQDEDGSFIKTDPETGDTAVPCNPDAPEYGGTYTFLMMSAALGYVIADVAADGMTVQYARREPLESRGNIQTTAYLTRTIGGICAQFLVGFGMNGREYLGNFDSSLTFNQVCGILAIPCVIMVPLSWFGIVEERATTHQSFKSYISQVWNLLKSKAMFYVLIYTFMQPVIGNISTTAAGNVKSEWAKVGNLENSMFSLLGSMLFAIGLWLTKKYFLNASWRMMLAVTTIGLNLLDMPFSYFTIYNVIRNQYFYLGESVLYDIPSAANFVVGTFYIVEMAEDGNEGLVYGLITTVANLGTPFARALGNQIYATFEPSLSDQDNYNTESKEGDTDEFRTTVAYSFHLTYFFVFISVLFIWFLPDQKEEAQARKATWSRHARFAYISVITIAVALCYAVTVNFLAMFPSTSCMKIVGGDGCEDR